MRAVTARRQRQDTNALTLKHVSCMCSSCSLGRFVEDIRLEGRVSGRREVAGEDNVDMVQGLPRA